MDLCTKQKLTHSGLLSLNNILRKKGIKYMNNDNQMRPFEQEFYAPKPTPFSLHMRVNPIWQLVRFLVLNIKMLIMVRKH